MKKISIATETQSPGIQVELRKTAGNFNNVIYKSSIETLFLFGESLPANGMSNIISVGDVYAVKVNGEYILVRFDLVHEFPENNLDFYSISIKH